MFNNCRAPNTKLVSSQHVHALTLRVRIYSIIVLFSYVFMTLCNEILEKILQMLDNHMHLDLNLTNSTIFNHLKLWIAVARHNFKWLKIKFITSQF